MRLTIIPVDSFVAVNGDGSHRPLDLATCNIPADVHALQWYESQGEIELNGIPKPANEEIIELPEWALACVSLWEAWTPPAPPEPPKV
jgi:hypothetical protein